MMDLKLQVRDDSLETDKLLLQHEVGSTLPKSVLSVLKGEQQEHDVLATREFQELVRRGPRERTRCAFDYSTGFHSFRFGEGLHDQVVLLKERGRANLSVEAQGLTIEKVMARKECLSWWRLLVEEFEKKCTFCPHGTNATVCEDPSCTKLRSIANDAELLQWEKGEQKRRDAAGLEPTCTGEVEAAAFGVTLQLERFGQTACREILASLAAICPEMVEEGTNKNAKGCSVSLPFHSHLKHRADQVRNVISNPGPGKGLSIDNRADWAG